MWSTGTGADVMKRIAAPLFGGIVTSFLLELAVYPAIFALWKRRESLAAPAGGASRARHRRSASTLCAGHPIRSLISPT